jgi:uncharacterized membrane protein YeaQ/YmgE (transglycosylase-associated protein family)
MLEIFFLRWYCTWLAAKARAKHRPGGWGAVGAIGWIGGEITGAVIAAKQRHIESGGIYAYALLGAAVGAVLALAIVSALSPQPDPNFPTARVVG